MVIYWLEGMKRGRWVRFEPADLDKERIHNLLRLNAADAENRASGFVGWRVVARLDVLNPERSEFARLINKAAADFGREWARRTEANLLAGAIALADEYGERGLSVPAVVCVTWQQEPLRPGEMRIT